MRALIMGGTEFISLHLVQSLLRLGHEVAVFNRGKRAERLPAGVRAIVGDRKDHAGHPHVIFVSTGRVYDHTLPIPYSEESPRSFYWGDYARHKIAGEDILLERHRRDGLPVTIVRPTHVYGPLNTRNNETFFMDRIGRGRPVLVPGHGGWLRQFGHVEDLADAMAAMLGDPRTYGQAYNVTGEELITQAGLVELIAEVMGRPVTLRHFDPALLTSVDRPGPVFGQNLVYERHAVHTTHKLRL